MFPHLYSHENLLDGFLQGTKKEKFKFWPFCKTKCIFVCGRKKTLQKPDPLHLDGKVLPWVESPVHLGNFIHESESMDKDAKVKRAAFIRESTELRETFGFASPSEVLRAVKLYAGSHYGSSLWQFDSESVQTSIKCGHVGTCAKA